MENLKLTPELMLFGGAAGLAAIAAVGVVAFNNAVRSALCLVVNFFVLAFLYFTLRAEMLGVTQIMVYTGAIMVLFLFVIMLLNLGSPESLEEKRDWKRPVGLLLGLAFFTGIGSQVLAPLISVTKVTSSEDYGGPHAIGRTLFTQYVFPFEAVSVLLLIGIVGSIVLAKRRVS